MKAFLIFLTLTVTIFLAVTIKMIGNEIPFLSQLAQLLPENRSELYEFFGLVLPLIPVLTPSHPRFTIINVIQVVQLAEPHGATQIIKPRNKYKVTKTSQKIYTNF